MSKRKRNKIPSDQVQINSDLVLAPFTPEQVKSLNGYQRSNLFHPYTCGDRSKLKHGFEMDILVATEAGWICPDPRCTYTQKTAQRYMASFAWMELGNFDIVHGQSDEPDD